MFEAWKWQKFLTPTWFEHATFWSGVRRATVAPRSPAWCCRDTKETILLQRSLSVLYEALKGGSCAPPLWNFIPFSLLCYTCSLLLLSIFVSLPSHFSLTLSGSFLNFLHSHEHLLFLSNLPMESLSFTGESSVLICWELLVHLAHAQDGRECKHKHCHVFNNNMTTWVEDSIQIHEMKFYRGKTLQK